MESKDKYNPEEEVATEGQWKLVDLPTVEDKSGEENFEEVFSARTKLYRWRKPEWKERGIGHFRIMKHKETTRIVGMLRQEGTKKIMAYFNILSLGELCDLTRLKTSDKTWVWTCLDFSDTNSNMQIEQFCLRFKTKEEFEKFEKDFNESKAHNDKLDWTDKKKEGEKKEETPTEEKKEEKKEEKEEKKEEKSD